MLYAASSKARARSKKSAGGENRPALHVALPVDIAPDDPLIKYFEHAPDAALVDSLQLDSPGVRALREAGVTLVVPLVSQGELVGLLNLGSRMGEQQYSGDDRALLNHLATQAAPAVRVAQLAGADSFFVKVAFMVCFFEG